MIYSKIFINALYVYASWLERDVKPDCKVPQTFINYPIVFEKKEFCMTCTCKLACRYDVPNIQFKTQN